MHNRARATGGIEVNSGQRAAQRAIPAKKCAKCGATQNLVRHHKDGNTANNSPSNVTVLCKTHHGAAHYKK